MNLNVLVCVFVCVWFGKDNLNHVLWRIMGSMEAVDWATLAYKHSFSAA